MRFLVWCVIGVGLVGCGHAAKLRPTPKGAVEVQGTFGGPMAKVEGFTLPLPLTTVGAGYGLSDRFDLEVNAHLTSLAFGVAGLDVGSTFLALEGSGAVPTVSVLGRVYGFADVHKLSRAAYLELGGTASWKLGAFSPYVTLAALGQLNGSVLPAAGAGVQVELGRFSLQGELRWYQPLYDTQFVVVDWINVANRGAIGPLISLTYRFGGER